MAAIINADDGAISGASGLKLSSDTSGALNIQTNGVTAIAISASQAVSFPATTSLNFTSANITTLTSSSATITNLLATTLTVSGVGIFPAGSASSAAITTAGDTNTGIFFPAADTIAFAEGGVEAARFDSAGNFGLGVTPSTWSTGKAIQINNVQASIWGAGDQINVLSNAYFNSGYKYAASKAASMYEQALGVHTWSTAAAGTAGNAISFTQAMTLGSNGNLAIGATNTTVAKLYVVGSGNANSIMTSTAAALTGSANAVWIGDDGTDALIGPGNSGSSLSFLSRAGGVYTKAMTLDASGQLGIGTTSPGALLHVYTSTQESVRFARNSTASSAYITFYANNSSSAQVQYAGILGDVASSTAGSHGGNLLFYTTGSGTSAERARITSGGYSKFSSNGSYLSSTAAYHEFYQSANNDALSIYAENSTTYNSDVLRVRCARATTNATYNLINGFNGNASGQFIVRDSGNVLNTNGSYGTISDAKMKTDIVDAGSQWNDLKAVRFRKFKMKNDPSGLMQLGVVAQELEQTSPGLVDEHTDRDAEGNDLGTTTKSVKTSVLLMKAAVALQEAMLRIEQLESKVSQLEVK